MSEQVFVNVLLTGMLLGAFIGYAILPQRSTSNILAGVFVGMVFTLVALVSIVRRKRK